MSVTCGKAPEKIATTLSFKGAAEKFKLTVTYHNIGTKAFHGLLEKKGATLFQVLLELIDHWDATYPLSLEGLEHFEDQRPGIINALLHGYQQSRQVELEKN